MACNLRMVPSRHKVTIQYTHTCTQTHNRFMTLLDFAWDYPGEPAPER